MNITPATPVYLAAVKELLRQEKLPVEDLSPELHHFFLATDGGAVVGCIGFEVYNDVALLRSMVVLPQYRNMRIAGQLVQEVERAAGQEGLKEMYLLTLTAEHYFTRKGYQKIDRHSAPETLKRSSEFSHSCPASAVLMLKKL